MSKREVPWWIVRLRDNWWETNLGTKSLQNLLCHSQRAKTTFFVTTKQNARWWWKWILWSFAGFTFNYRPTKEVEEDDDSKAIFESFLSIEFQLVSSPSSVQCLSLALSSIFLSLECVSFSKVLNIFLKFISPIKKTFLTEDVSRLFFSLIFPPFSKAHKTAEKNLCLWREREKSKHTTIFIMIRLKDVMKFFSFSNMCHDFLVSVFLFLIHVKNSFSSPLRSQKSSVQPTSAHIRKDSSEIRDNSMEEEEEERASSDFG